jgi:hypothetical protein
MAPAADGIAQQFPGWHIWRSQAGRWWATRLGNVAWDRHHDPGFAMTVDADTPAELVMVLARQPQVPADPVRRPRPNTRSSPNTG